MRQTLIVLAALIALTGLILYLTSRPDQDTSTAPPQSAADTAAVPSASAPSTPRPSTLDPPSSPSGTRPSAYVPPPDPRIGRTQDGETILNQPAEMSRSLNAPGTDAREDIEILDDVLSFYRKVYGENPVVENEAAVTQALMGNNPKNIIFIDPNHPSLSENGALLDRFGNPYYFHAISGTQMDIVSSGPDGKRGTPDDIHLDLNAGEALQLNEGAE